MEANEAFHLFANLRDLLTADLPEEGDVEMAGLIGCRAVTLRTEGSRSKGLWVLGRRADTMAEHEQARSMALARALGAVCHAVEAASGVADAIAEAMAEPLRVLVTTSGGQAEAEVAVGLAAEVRTGHGRDESPLAAVARATIDTVDPAIELVHAADDELGGERAVLVVVRRGEDHTAIGAALSGTDPLRATAAAALQAAANLPR
ncbi:MAG: hypothetical protein JWO37_4021 [Acidimicrobiales bacterium]|jgi:hypothetical protein|nr:hypothetical protein [Acidimicrobiales bacterium]